MKKTIHVVMLLFSTILNAVAQTGTPVSIDSENDYSVYDYSISKKPILLKLKTPLDISEMHLLNPITTDERELIAKAENPPAIGIIRDLANPVRFTLSNISIPLNGEISTSGGRLTRLNKDTLVFTSYFRSEKANEVRLFFPEGHLPNGVQVNLFGKDGHAFTQTELTGRIGEYGFYTTTVFSDNVTLQVVMPIGIISEDVHFVISKITHIEDSHGSMNTARDILSCYEDVNCSNANGFGFINSLRRSTAKLRFPAGNLIGFCSGGLLNDSRSADFQPFLLTANHCFSTPASANGLEAVFEYWSTSCNSGTANPNTFLVSGANIIRTSSQTDFTLVLLKQKPGGNRTYLGWTTSNVLDNALLNSVHHPESGLQKWSMHQNKTAPAYSCSSPTFFHYTRTLAGQTVGGSSGGVIMNSAGRVVGQLRGSCGSTNYCNYSGYYDLWGRFSATFNNNNLQYWLFGGGASVRMATSPASTLPFGEAEVQTSKDLPVIVTNTGTVPAYLNLEAGSAYISGANANQFSIVGANALYLPPGVSGNFTIRFSPVQTGAKSAVLNIPNNADNLGGNKTIILTGCAIPEQPGNILGPVNPARDLLYTYSVPPVPGAISYTWTYDGGGTPIGIGTSCYLAVSGNGTLKVTANVSCGSSRPQTMKLAVTDGIRIYPNPVMAELTIEYSGPEKISFELFNALGQMVLKNNFTGRITVPTAHLAPGVYTIRFENGGKTEFRKIVKE